MTTPAFPPKKILVPTDLSATSLPALHFARVLHRQFGGEVHVLHARHFELPPYFSSGQIQGLTREVRKSAKAATEYLRRESTAVLGFEAALAIVEKPPVEAILETAGTLGAGLIVMGTHGRRGADRFWLGSVAERILHESTTPILAVRQGMTAAPFGHILCPLSFTDLGRQALEYAIAMTDAGRLRLTVLHALEEGDRPLNCALVPAEVRERCNIEELTYHGDAAKVILSAAKEYQPDLIVMGAERKLSVFGELFSSTTERVMQWADAPLLVVPRPAEVQLTTSGDKGGSR
jgi:nucleotide-binding universal stress UspA family protein